MLDSSQLNQSERSWVRLLVVLPKLPSLSTVTWSRVYRVNLKNTIDYVFYSDLIRGVRFPSG